MIKLGELELPKGMVWEGELNWTPVQSETERTLGGRLVVWEDQVLGGRPVDLVAYENQGWLTREQVKALRQMASEPGATYTLLYGPDGEEQSLIVRFRHEDPPVLEMEPLLPRSNAQDGDYYYGRIKLVEV